MEKPPNGHATDMIPPSTVQSDNKLAIKLTARVEKEKPLHVNQDILLLKQRMLATAEDPAIIEAVALDEKRQKDSRISLLATQLGARYSPERVLLDKYRVTNAKQGAIVAQVKELRSGITDHVAGGRGIIFLGTIGTGKDHLMAYLLYSAAASGASCKWIGGQDLYGRIRDQVGDKGRENDLIADFAGPQVLAISDPVPPSGDVSDWQVSQFYRILDRRYRDMKCTWVTLNVKDGKEASGQLSSPVWDRLREAAVVFECNWPSHRERA